MVSSVTSCPEISNQHHQGRKDGSQALLATSGLFLVLFGDAIASWIALLV